MREIKFRVWNGKRMCDVYSIIPFERIAVTADGVISASLLEQYTGLKDKNGKEIYEGDILRDGKGEAGRVDYVKNTASFMMYADSQYWFLNEGNNTRPCQLQYTEVIGTIHEGEVK